MTIFSGRIPEPSASTAMMLAAVCAGVILALALDSRAQAGNSTHRLDPSTATLSHDDWAEVLERRVDAHGLVDYAGLAKDRDALDRYLAAIAVISPETRPELFPTPEHELAYLINAYNALVFGGVLERWPDIESVWSGLISGYSFFVSMKVEIGGRRMSLKQLEDHEIRARFGDARIHAALNCASLGCPRLPREPFLAETLNQQLDAAIRAMVSDQRHVEIDPENQTAHLSKIFDWFEEDFIAWERRLRGSSSKHRLRLVDAINRYRQTGKEIPGSYRLSFRRYDKRLNQQRTQE